MSFHKFSAYFNKLHRAFFLFLFFWVNVSLSYTRDNNNSGELQQWGADDTISVINKIITNTHTQRDDERKMESPRQYILIQILLDICDLHGQLPDLCVFR